jgi:hypothetical protein
MPKQSPAKRKNPARAVETPADQLHLVAAILAAGTLPRDLPSDRPNIGLNAVLKNYRQIVRTLSRPAGGMDEGPETDAT